MTTTAMSTPTSNQPFGRNPDDSRWQAVGSRDKAADGSFWYGVLTTGVFCKPSCPSRMARRENVVFFPTMEAAAHAGLRPCKRCRPTETEGSREAVIVAAACKRIDEAEFAVPLAELADASGLSRFHFHRLFKAQTGVTPRGYAAARRAERVRRELAGGAPVTQAIYDAGFSASSRFYADAGERLGMTPSRFRSGAPSETIRFALGECFLGSILVAATAKGVCAILLGDDPELLLRNLQDRFPAAELTGGDADFEQVVAQAVGLVEHPGQGAELPLDIRGTAFQERVWQALRTIPPGSTASYAEIAARLGAPKAVRAVAGACAANPLAVAIPCHRVVRSDGDLSGYRWGVERKRKLIARETEPGRERERERG